MAKIGSGSVVDGIEFESVHFEGFSKRTQGALACELRRHLTVKRVSPSSAADDKAKVAARFGDSSHAGRPQDIQIKQEYTCVRAGRNLYWSQALDTPTPTLSQTCLERFFQGQATLSTVTIPNVQDGFVCIALPCCQFVPVLHVSLHPGACPSSSIGFGGLVSRLFCRTRGYELGRLWRQSAVRTLP